MIGVMHFPTMASHNVDFNIIPVIPKSVEKKPEGDEGGARRLSSIEEAGASPVKKEAKSGFSWWEYILTAFTLGAYAIGRYVLSRCSLKSSIDDPKVAGVAQALFGKGALSKIQMERTLEVINNIVNRIHADRQEEIPRDTVLATTVGVISMLLEKGGAIEERIEYLQDLPKEYKDEIKRTNDIDIDIFIGQCDIEKLHFLKNIGWGIDKIEKVLIKPSAQRDGKIFCSYLAIQNALHHGAIWKEIKKLVNGQEFVEAIHSFGKREELLQANEIEERIVDLRRLKLEFSDHETLIKAVSFCGTDLDAIKEYNNKVIIRSNLGVSETQEDLKFFNEAVAIWKEKYPKQLLQLTDQPEISGFIRGLVEEQRFIRIIEGAFRTDQKGKIELIIADLKEKRNKLFLRDIDLPCAEVLRIINEEKNLIKRTKQEIIETYTILPADFDEVFDAALKLFRGMIFQEGDVENFKASINEELQVR